METTESANRQSALDELFQLTRTGDIIKCSKVQLERYAAVLCSLEARTRRRDPEFTQVGETVRTLLIVRMSEEANKQATRISLIALGVAVLSLLVAILALFRTQSVGILLRGQ